MHAASQFINFRPTKRPNTDSCGVLKQLKFSLTTKNSVHIQNLQRGNRGIIMLLVKVYLDNGLLTVVCYDHRVRLQVDMSRVRFRSKCLSLSSQSPHIVI